MSDAPSCQRWRDRRDSYRPAGEIINPREYEAVSLDGPGSDTTAKAFVERHHYPPSEAVLRPLPCDRLEGVELGRFILLDDVPGNGESWFLARCFDVLRARGYRALLSHSDPVPRRALDGRLVLPGHVGTIYQATNAVYAGRSGASKHVLKPDGTVFSSRSMTKIRRWERGAQGCVDELVAIGAPAPTREDLRDRDARRIWMWRAIARTCRRAHHGGNHRYLWALDKRLRRSIAAMATGAPYPKERDPEPVDVAA